MTNFMNVPIIALATTVAALVSPGMTRGQDRREAPQLPPARLEVTIGGVEPQASFEWCGAYLLWSLAAETLTESALGQTWACIGSRAAQLLVLSPCREAVVALPPESTVEFTLSSALALHGHFEIWTEPTWDLEGSTLPQPEVLIIPNPGREACSVREGEAYNLHDLAEKGVSSFGRTQYRIPLFHNPSEPSPRAVARIVIRSSSVAGAIRVGGFTLVLGENRWTVPISPQPTEEVFPPPRLPIYLPGIDAGLVEWDWRLQDGIGTPREPRSFSEALQLLLQRVEKLLSHLSRHGYDVRKWQNEFGEILHQYTIRASSNHGTDDDWRAFWREVRWWGRKLISSILFVRVGPLAFVKHVPAAFSHQLTQYYGRDARPGGGIFLLPQPGTSMTAVDLVGSRLPCGSYQHLDVSADGSRLLFAFCAVDKPPMNREAPTDRYFHVYELRLHNGELCRLTDGPYDHFAPRYLPDGKIVLVSTRRGGFHRCGRGPAPVYTLSLLKPDGTIHVISYHETHEWDPAVLWDGRILYTRWDYVDRHAVFYQQLWTVRPDGTNVQIYFGNGTFNPVGIWEVTPIPGSHRVMATAAAHHAMTAGSIILLDINRGLDGLVAIERLTPDAPFPESEVPVIREPGGHWFAPVGVAHPLPLPVEARRWPGHCYRSPLPLDEDHFIAAYSYDPLIGEPTANRANMFGLYLCDRFGNKELIYRDLNHSSLWAVFLRARPKPTTVASALNSEITPAFGGQSGLSAVPMTDSVNIATNDLVRAVCWSKGPGRLPERSGPIGQGIFFLQNVYEAWPALPDVRITRLRIVQVLPKTTPHINTPPVGTAHASPGKQVLGTVPVEPDGSAYFVAPAGVPLSFQALDELGQAVQIMRSVTYLQPGEVTSCLGCHQPRTMAPKQGPLPAALRRPPSQIVPGPPGSRPLSFPLLVQPILDRHCIRCHNDQQAEAAVNLLGRPEGKFTASYLALAPRVKTAAWDSRSDFLVTNCEPYTRPDFFGARGSPLMKLLLAGHAGITLSPAELEALATWMDTNALFYGTFDPEDQKRQLRGEEITGPAWE